MRLALFLVGTAFASLLLSLTAHAQYGSYGSGYDDELIRCESRDGRTERCDTGGAPARFVRQLSSSPCVRNRTWGADNYGVWVSSGCRAEFQIDRYGGGYGGGYGSGYGNDYGNDIIRCESRDGRTNRCDTGGRDASLIRQLSSSPCREGSTWGNDSRGIWVSGGCRGEFRLDDRYGGGYGGGHNSGGVVRCESRDNRSTSCAMPNSRRSNIRLIRQLSSTPCVEGDTWGRTNTGIWVTRGCRGEFVASRGSGGGWGPPGGSSGNSGQSIRCESNDQRTVRCGVEIFRRAELVRQLSDSPCTEGGSWGWDRSGVWVSRGCRGEFRVW